MTYRNKAELIAKLVRPTDVVLDVGFWGQGVREGSPHWPHTLLKQVAKEVYGVDIDMSDVYSTDPHYRKSSAEDFDFSVKFDLIFAGDIIEHLSNPGLFLASCKRNLSHNGRLIITTPNAFNLFNLAEKLTKREPTVNHDHTCYFNEKTLAVLLEKNGFRVAAADSLYSLGIGFEESWRKKILNGLYAVLALVTDKFIETLVVTAEILP
jgi:2-polyprenyl-3-methyl-5-hydroxy-6-metoxy-1,4-benzoquinol methylase